MNKLKQKNVNILIKPSSSKCNLNCPYCFYDDIKVNREISDHGFISDVTMINIIDNAFDLVESNGSINFAFQGGEPTLIGIDFYRDFINYVESLKQEYSDISISYLMQTNGTLIDDSWLDLFEKYQFFIGVSIDGYRKNTNRFRVNNCNEGQYELIIANLKKIQERDIRYSIITVLTETLANNAKNYYNFIKNNRISHIQIMPCLAPLNDKPLGFEVSARNFAKFYIDLFDLWYKDFLMTTTKVNVLMFNDIIPMYLGVRPTQCGMLGYCSPQIVIEADGSVYPCDFYVLDDFYLGNVNKTPLREIVNNPEVEHFTLFDQKQSKMCKKCRYLNMCNGNCKRQRKTFLTNDYCGYQEFLNKTERKMRQVAKLLSKGD